MHEIDLNNSIQDKKGPKRLVQFSLSYRSRVMAQRTLIMYYNWFTNSFILYGLGLNWQALTGSLFTNFMIGA